MSRFEVLATTALAVIVVACGGSSSGRSVKHATTSDGSSQVSMATKLAADTLTTIQSVGRLVCEPVVPAFLHADGQGATLVMKCSGKQISLSQEQSDIHTVTATCGSDAGAEWCESQLEQLLDMAEKSQEQR